MNPMTQEICPYGPEYQVYWNMRYSLFSKFDQCRVNSAGLYTMVPEDFALGMARMVRGSSVLDICSSIGSMSIAFARTGKRVISIEIEQDRVAMARHNAAVYGVSGQIDFRTADITDDSTFQNLPDQIDTVFMDPPWGTGPGEYIRHKRKYLSDLSLAGMDLREIVRMLPCNEVLMRFPPNFDFDIFKKITGDKIALTTKTGYLHFYILRTRKEEFLKTPDRSE